MAKTRKGAAEQIYDQLFATRTRRKKYPALHTYLSQGGSIFPLVDKGIHGLVADYRMTTEDARVLLRQLNSMAIYIRRRFIEHTLTGGKPGKARKGRKTGPASGVLRMVDGPDYRSLFGTDFEALCSPNDLRSWWSPAAYLVDLTQWINTHIEPRGDATKLLLWDRRRDLQKLIVDFNTVYQSVPSIEIIIEVLEAFIIAHGPKTDLEDALIDERYPNELPYYQHWVTINAITESLGMSAGDFILAVHEHFPSFVKPSAWNTDAEGALVHASRMGPYQRSLLTESAVAFPAGKLEFFYKNFGFTATDKDEDNYTHLSRVSKLGERTGLEADGIEALLSIRAFAPVRSPNVTFNKQLPGVLESGQSGSVFINAKRTADIGIVEDLKGVQSLTLDPDEEADFRAFERINRKVRMDKMLGVTSDEGDALLVAAIRADVRGGAAADEWWITENVVKALGLYRLLHERCECSALDFAAILDEMPTYGRGQVPSLFDQVFNSLGNYPKAFKLDGGTFPVTPPVNSTELTVNQICSALNINLLEYRYLAQAIAMAHGLDDTLARTSPIISSFFRLVKLSRLFDIPPVETVLTLQLLGGVDGNDWLKGLAGRPAISSLAGGKPDALDLIHILYSFAQWCKDRDLQVLWTLQHITEPEINDTASLEQLQLFEKLHNLLPAALLTHTSLLNNGVPSYPAGNWLSLMSELVDSDGLVLAFSGTKADFVIFARKELELAVSDGLPRMANELRAAIVEKMLTVLLQARDAQVSAVKESLAVLTGLDAERALLALDWTGTTVYRLLRSILSRNNAQTEAVRRGRVVEPESLLKILAQVQQRSEVINELDLIPAFLQDLLDYGQKAWLGQDDKSEFTLRTFYGLNVFIRATELGEQPQQVLLDYLKDVNKLPTNLTGDALDLAQKAAAIRLGGFFDWSVQNVSECISHITSPSKILTNLPQLDQLVRVRTLADQTRMDAKTIFRVGKLPLDTDKAAYAAAAELALLSQSETRSIPQPAGEVDQLVQISCTVEGNNYAVANKPGEKITFKVTLTDAKGTALKGVNVYWQTALGSIATVATGTDGTLLATFVPGSVLGKETPRFWLDLFKSADAPEIHVVADSQTLRFSEKSPVPSGPVNTDAVIRLSAKLEDRHLNPGINELVDWSADPPTGVRIQPTRQTYTDSQGITEVFVTTTTPRGGTFKIFVRSQASDSGTVFDPITFEPPE
jgi:hypothetical protein